MSRTARAGLAADMAFLLLAACSRPSVEEAPTMTSKDPTTVEVTFTAGTRTNDEHQSLIRILKQEFESHSRLLSP